MHTHTQFKHFYLKKFGVIGSLSAFRAIKTTQKIHTEMHNYTTVKGNSEKTGLLSCLVAEFPSLTQVSMRFTQFATLSPVLRAQNSLAKISGRCGCFAVFSCLGVRSPSRQRSQTGCMIEECQGSKFLQCTHEVRCSKKCAR